ncbi:MAG: FtsW/RodA/SpoVE family cell cycle protein, partial [Holosporaceae bacterium]|nr:FtsW/RodA/SpoVE family cell cycle protein [Holosporaceae bacterium]
MNEFKILFALVFCLLIIGLLGQYSAFNGEFNEFVQRHVIRILLGLLSMMLAYAINLRTWGSVANLLYIFSLSALAAVDLLGVVRSGAQRWMDLYFCTFQPS